jgi:hypothetical protein
MVEDTRRPDGDGPMRAETPVRSASMRARTWAVATCYGEPTDYDIPALPTWTVSRPTEGGVAFADGEGEAPFIRAERPVKVRR